MPLPLAPLIPFAIRLGAVAAAGWVVKRVVSRGLQTGRTDQRAEDALDDLDEGIALHRPVDRNTETDSQTNAAVRVKRTLHWGARGVEIDAGLLARFRIRKI